MSSRSWVQVLLIPLCLAAPLPALGATWTELVSVSSYGEEENGESVWCAISADGQFVAFSSTASNLVPDTNMVEDAFVRDRQTGTTERVSVTSSGEEGNGGSYCSAVSVDARYVAFHSYASNLVPGDSNGAGDIFVHDRQTGITERVSVSSSGEEGNGDSHDAAVSADGRFVAFNSYATNLVPDDTNDMPDAFVHDRQTGATERVSVSSTGEEGDRGLGFGASKPAISADGRYVAFDSSSTNLVPGDTNHQIDTFVRDRQTGTTERVSVSSTGEQGDVGSDAGTAAISADGRYVAFDSYATNLVPGDTNGATDIFVRDRQTGTTERVSVSSTGEQGNTWSGIPAISADGGTVGFCSGATNLVPAGTNGLWDIFVRARWGFRDIFGSYWAYDEITACANANIVQGYWDGTYRPEEAVTRAQMAVYISRGLVQPSGDAAVPGGPAVATFPDVPTDHWAFKYVEYCYDQAVVQGYWDGYHPDEAVNRAQMAVFVARAMVAPSGDAAIPDPEPPPTFPDVPATYWAYKWIEYCHGQGVVQGYWDGYHPEETVNRAQMAVYVQRAFQLPM